MREFVIVIEKIKYGDGKKHQITFLTVSKT